MKRPLTPETIAPGIRFQVDRPPAALGVYLLAVLVAIVFAALCVPLLSFAVLAVVAHTIFPIWWKFPSYVRGQYSQPRPGQALGEPLAAWVAINLLFLIGIVVVQLGADFMQETERARRAQLAMDYPGAGWDADEPEAEVAEPRTGVSDISETADVEDRALVFGLPTYFTLPDMAQLLGIPFAMATFFFGAWWVTAVHETAALARERRRERLANPGGAPLHVSDIERRPLIRWIGPRPPWARRYSDPGVTFIDGPPGEPEGAGGIDPPREQPSIFWLDDLDDGAAGNIP